MSVVDKDLADNSWIRIEEEVSECNAWWGYVTDHSLSQNKLEIT